MSHPNTDPTDPTEPQNIVDPPQDPSEPQIIPQTPPPKDFRTDERYAQLLENTVKEQNRRIAELEQSRVAPTPPAAPPRTAEEIRAEFYNNPEESTRRIISQELDATVSKLQPLLDWSAQQQGNTVIDRLINSVKLNPRFAANWSPSVERYVREQAATVDPSRLNDQAIMLLTTSAIGMRASGFFEDDTPAPTPSAPTRVTPPYIPPSAAPVPTPNNRQVIKPLNENEKRILREFNANKAPKDQMSETQYREWQNMPAQEVAFTKFDK